MDQLKPILENAYKYRFWIICGLVVSLSLVFSFLAASSTRADIQKQKDAIKASFDQADRLRAKSDPPNEASHQAMRAKIEEIKEGVRVAWQKQYDYQNEGPNKLVWPAALGQEFIGQVTPLHPIERIPYPTTADQEILDFYRINYRNYIKRELPILSALIGAQWHPKNEFSEESAADDDKKYVVEWQASNQTFLQDSRFDWGSVPPTTLEVLYSQEDLWVLRTVLQVVQETNGNVDARYKAAIKRIDSILLGQDVTAMQDDATLQEPNAGKSAGSGGNSGGSGGSSPMGMDMNMGMDDSGAEGGAGSGGTSKAAAGGTRDDPAHMRYVDNNFQGVPASTVRKALTSTDSKLALYAVAKRIPVRLQMSIDQRRLNKFLTACGNAPLQIEIKRVRVNRKSNANPTGGGGGGSGMGMGGEGMMDNMGAGEGPSMGNEERGDGFGFGNAASARVKELSDVSPFDVDVEIYGMVYIYNPVDLDRLGIDEPPPAPEPAPGTSETPAQQAIDENQNAAAAAANNPQAG